MASGLNPLLQYPEMQFIRLLCIPVIRASPSHLHLRSPRCLDDTREKVDSPHAPLTMIAWAFSPRAFAWSAWAYAVLGWSGYWGWDPVENASLMPVATGTAFLAFRDHCRKSRHDARVERVVVFLTFMLCHFGYSLRAAARSIRFTHLRNRILATGSGGFLLTSIVVVPRVL